MDTRIQGAIFDMDGVISDTQSLHARIESDLLRRYGIIMSPEEIIRRFAGTADKEMFPAIFTEAGKSAPDVDAIVAQKYSLMIAAEKAGMKIVALLTHREAGDCPASVSFIVRDLQEVPLSIF